MDFQACHRLYRLWMDGKDDESCQPCIGTSCNVGTSDYLQVQGMSSTPTLPRCHMMYYDVMSSDGLTGAVMPQVLFWHVPGPNQCAILRGWLVVHLAAARAEKGGWNRCARRLKMRYDIWSHAGQGNNGVLTADCILCIMYSISLDYSIIYIYMYNIYIIYIYVYIKYIYIFMHDLRDMAW